MTDICDIYLVAGLLVLAAGIGLAIKHRKRIEVCLRIFSASVIITNFVLLIPITGPNIFVVFVNALQIGSLDAAYNEWITGTADAYSAILSVLSAISPILLGGAILSFFENEFNKLRYLLLAPFKNICYFSELNEKSLILARGLERASKEYRKNHLIVFCNAGGSSDKILLSEAKEQGFIVIPDNECGRIGKTKRLQYFFEISHDMDLNLNSTKELIDSFTKQETGSSNVKIFLFSNQIEAEIILNATDKRGIEIMLVNDAVATAYDLIFNRPLFEAFENGNNKTISVLIAGAGNLGKEILKSVLWCGQMGDEYTLEIKVIDRDADYHRSIFINDCPEAMSGEYDITFINADVNTDSFEEVLNHHCKSSNYIVVCLGDDEQNIKTAIELRGYYLRTSDNFDNEPIINVLVRSDIKSNCVRELTAINRESIIKKGWDITSGRAENYNLYPFGSYSSVYSYDFLLESEIEALALNGHAVYELAFSDNMATANDIRQSYFINEINKRSSRANAIHIKYKLFIMGFFMKNKNESSMGGNNKNDVGMLIEMLNDSAWIEKLSKLEHLRWTAFQRCEGYRGASIAQAEEYKKYTGSHRQLRSKMHACICPWEDLDAVAQVFDPYLKKYDENFIKCIPQILGSINDRINISSVSYVVAHDDDGLA